MISTRLRWAARLLVIFAAGLRLHVAKSEHAAADGFDGFVQSLAACKAHTQGDFEQLVCITARVM